MRKSYPSDVSRTQFAIINRVLEGNKLVCISDLQDYECKQVGRKQIPSMIIIDSKTIQNADTAREKGYDGGKKNRN